MESKQHGAITLYSLAQCLYWVGGCAVISFSVVYLTEKGFSSSDAGLICSAAAALGFFMTSALSNAVDTGRLRSSAAGQLLFLTSALALVCAMLSPGAGLLLAICYTAALASLQATVFFYNKLYADMCYEGVSLDFGLARGLGSLAFSLASALLGLYVRGHGAAGLSALALLLVAAQSLCVFLLYGMLRSQGGPEKSAPGLGISLRRFFTHYRRFSVFLIGAGLVSAVNLTLTTFLIQIVERSGGSADTLGFLNGFMALIEIPVMFLYARIRSRIPPRKLVLIALAFYCAKILGFTFAASIPLLYAAAAMHALSFGLFTPASVDYAMETIPRADTAKSQGLMAMTPTLFSCVTLAAFGFLRDLCGLSPALCVYACLAFLGLFLCLRSV